MRKMDSGLQTLTERFCESVRRAVRGGGQAELRETTKALSTALFGQDQAERFFQQAAGSVARLVTSRAKDCLVLQLVAEGLPVRMGQELVRQGVLPRLNAPLR